MFLLRLRRHGDRRGSLYPLSSLTPCPGLIAFSFPSFPFVSFLTLKMSKVFLLSHFYPRESLAPEGTV